ncbi:MAG: efflux RND transporter permease subunit [Nitrospirae bacterium]|nr:efflux RND transporter permease subunit [Nitrospirota bacterium]
MVDKLLEFSLRRRVLILTFAGFLTLLGAYAFRTIPIDAFPDVTSVLVQVVTKAPGLSPEEVERLVTFPIEQQLTGVPHLTELRSLTKVGLSLMTVVFDDTMNINLARQLVLERLIEVQENLPPGSEPSMAPNSTGLGEVYQYYLESPPHAGLDSTAVEHELIEQRTTMDWVIRPVLKSVPGVIDVNSQGGYVKQYQVLVEPGLLHKYDISLHDVFTAVANNNANAAGNILETHAEKYIVRGVGMIRKLSDIEDIVVKEVGGTPVHIHDVAQVQIGHAIRHGAVVLNGQREVVAGIVLMLRGGNARDVVEGIKAKLDEIRDKRLLPPGWRIIPFYDRIELISAALKTVYKALGEGILLVVVVLFLFLGDTRSALIVAATLILTPLVTFSVMDQFGLTANLMSLGGLAIAIGMMVDASVVVVENVHRHLSDPRHQGLPRKSIILNACREVARPVVFGIVIIIIVFMPILSFEGMEGKMFKPMAYTIMIALMVSLILSITLSPVLCYLSLRAGHNDPDPLVLRWAKRAYIPLLRWALGHRIIVLTTTALTLAGSIALFPYLGTEFVPILNEGTMAPLTIRLPSISLEQSIKIEKEVQQAVMEFPEVQMMVSKIGRTELANDPQEPNESDSVARLHPMDTWTTAPTMVGLKEKVRERLARVPGANFLLSQPIQQRVDELISGVRAEVTVKLFGHDLDVLRQTGDQIAGILRTIRGVKDLKVEQLFGQPYITIEIDRSRIARHGINVSDIREIIATAVGGEAATRVYEENRRFNLIVRFPEQYRNSIETIGNIRLSDRNGAFIPLSDLGTIRMHEGPGRINREHLQRYLPVSFNTHGRDIGGIVAEAQERMAREVRLPEGYYVVWGGSFENMQRAMARIKIIVPITIAVIFVLLFSSFSSLRQAALIILNLPFALIGGIVALWITGEYLSVPASVGFINLFGVAVLNGIVLVSYINSLRQQEGKDVREAVLTGCVMRLRPVLMTALVALLGLVPLALSQGIGSEVQRPLAVVVIGGLVSSTFLTLVVLPVLYQWIEGRTAAPKSPPTVATGD